MTNDNIAFENIKIPRGVARSEADAKRFAEEDAALSRAKEAARAAREAAMAAAAARMSQTNGNANHNDFREKTPATICTPTLPESAVVTPSTRGPRIEGQRDLQHSTFSISGEHVDLILLIFKPV